MRIIEQVIHTWQETGVKLNPAASPNDLDYLSTLLDCAIPEDISEFYQSANGMPENVYDNHWVSFGRSEKWVQYGQLGEARNSDSQTS